MQLAKSALSPAEIVNASFAPTRTPYDWLSRDPAVADAFMKDPLCFAGLQPAANESFFGAASQLADPAHPGGIGSDLPIYLFSGSEDPVGQPLASVRVLIERYSSAGIRDITYDFYLGGRHECLMRSTEVKSGPIYFIGSVPFFKPLPQRPYHP